MRVAVISAAFPPMAAGEATNAYHLCHRLASRGVDVHVLTSQGNAAVAESAITVHPVMRSWSWPEVPRLRAFIKQCQPDVVYFMYIGWMYGFGFMTTFLPTLVKRASARTRVVTRFENVHGAFARHNSFASRAVRKMVTRLDAGGDIDYQFGTLLRDSDAVVVLSTRHQEFLESLYRPVGAKCVVIPPPANMHMSAPGEETRRNGRDRLGLQPDEFLMAYVGFVYPGKGIETLLRSFARLRAERPRIRLAVIGGQMTSDADGGRYFADMKQLAVSLGVDGDVIWAGEFSFDSDKASTYLRACDVCVLPFDAGVRLNNSSFSSAAAHGIPIVTTDDGNLEAPFVHGTNVFLSAPRDPAALAQALETLIDDERLRAGLSRGALQLAREWFSWDAACDRTMAVLKRPIEHPHSRREHLRSA